jgi:hypothetical protein
MGEGSEQREQGEQGKQGEQGEQGESFEFRSQLFSFSPLSSCPLPPAPCLLPPSKN